MDKYCGWCNEIAHLSCGNCNQTFYCGSEHQRKHWSKHKLDCKPYKVVEHSILGKHLVASRNLAAGVLILKESPFALGPPATSLLVCLGCYTPITSNKFDKCLECSWPLCSLECPSIEEHKRECQVLRRDTKKSGVPQRQGETPRYDLILLVKCLLLRETNPSLWQTILTMQGHGTERKLEAEPHHVAAVRFISEVFKLDFEIDVIHHVRGTIITNSINTCSKYGVMLRGLYTTISLLNHSCLPNVTLRSDQNHTLFIRTAVEVKKNEPLVFSYVPTTYPIWKRQEELTTIYRFKCLCKRCQDPKELNLYYSSPRCSNCSHVIQSSSEQHWTCQNCKQVVDVKNIAKTVSEEMIWIENKKLDLKHQQLFLKNISEKFHKSHFLYFAALERSLQFLTDQKCLKSFQLQKSIWEELLQIQNIIEPGLTRKRGITLLKYAKVTYELLKHQSSRKNMTSEESAQVLAEYEKLYRNVIQKVKSVLDFEPTNSTVEVWVAEAKELEAKVLLSLKALV